MPIIFTERGFRFVIYFNDHTPPHCHVYKAEKSAEVYIDPVDVRVNRGFSPQEMKRVLRITRQRQDELLVAWNMIHE